MSFHDIDDLEFDIYTEQYRTHRRISQTVRGGQFRIPKLEVRNVEEVVSAEIEAYVFNMGLLRQMLRNCISEFDGLAAEEGHILLPPGGRSVVVGVGRL